MRRNHLIGVTLLIGLFAHTAPAAAPATPDALFQLDKIWSIHLTFTPDQWDAMEPTFAHRNAAAPATQPTFTPATILAPEFLRTADADRDRRLTRDEFRALAETWFASWDASKAGSITLAQLRAGLDATLGVPVLWRGNAPMLLNPRGGRNGVAAVAGVEYAYARATLDFDGQILKDVAVRYKGNGTFLNSRNTPKRPLKLDVNRHAKGRRLAGLTTINLHNGVTDPGYMNEVLAYRLYRDFGVPAPRTAYARVYVTVPGHHARQYLGLYSVVEEVDKRFAADRFKVKGGAIFKPVTTSPFADLGDDWARYQQIYDPKTDLTAKQTRRLIDFARLVSAAADETFAAKVADYVDLDAFAKYLAVTTWLSACDSILTLGQNYFVHLDPKSDRFQFIPWDLDHAFGQFANVGSREIREELSVRHPWRGHMPFFDRLFAVDAFRTKYLAAFAELAQLSRPERFERQVDELATILRPAVEEESDEKLTRFDRAVAYDNATPIPHSIKGFVPARARSVADQLAGRSAGLELPSLVGARGGPMGPGPFLAAPFMTALDANRDGRLTRAETLAGFDTWFTAWLPDGSASLTDAHLRTGIDRDLKLGR